MKAEVTQAGALVMQVCVPKEWTDEEVKAFADRENMCGTTRGWQIRKAWSALLAGAPERVQCSQRAGCVHVMLDA